MQVTKFLDTKAGMVVAVAAVGAIGLYFAEKRVRQAAAAVSPTNPDNVFASGVDSVGASITGNENFKLGGWIYETLHGSSMQQIENQQAIETNELASFWAGYPTK